MLGESGHDPPAEKSAENPLLLPPKPICIVGVSLLPPEYVTSRDSVTLWLSDVPSGAV